MYHLNFSPKNSGLVVFVLHPCGGGAPVGRGSARRRGGGEGGAEFGYVLAPCLSLLLLPTIVITMLPSLLRKGSMHTFIFQTFCQRRVGRFYS